MSIDTELAWGGTPSPHFATREEAPTAGPFILTASGRRISRSAGVPSLEDIALGLARTPRFAGQAKVPFSVLHHSLLVERLTEIVASALRPEWRLAARRWALLHDAHEAVTGDVPTPFKTRECRALQDALDERIAGAYLPGGWLEQQPVAAHIKMVDTIALQLEGDTIGPTAWREQGINVLPEELRGLVPDAARRLVWDVWETIGPEGRFLRRCWELEIRERPPVERVPA